MSRLRPGREVPYLLLLPAATVIVAVVLLPLLVSLYSSFTAYNMTHPASLYRWVGWRNYQRLMESTDFWWALGRTVVFLTVALNLEMALGLAIALLVSRVTRGQRLLRTIIMFPMMFSPILVGFQFNFLLNDNVGLLDNLLLQLGVISQPIAWLVDGATANLSILVAEIWMSTSVFAILLLAGLFAMPRDPLEAARVDGCNAWQTFRYITLPFLSPFITIAMTIRSLDVGRAYDMVRIMTNGGPAGRTELLWTLMATVGFQNAQMGAANAMAYVSIILSVAFTVYFYRRLMASRRFLEGMA
ncbi:MAG TPA: sugar ABC transporter permease [Bradyrhizobium sp.]